MLVIRFARRGRNKQAFFHLVVAEKKNAVQKKITEKLGFLNPHAEGGKGEFVFDAEKLKKYITNGAQLSQRVARELSKAGVKEAGKFIKARPTKPKKDVVKTPEKEEAPVADSEDTVKDDDSANNAETPSDDENTVKDATSTEEAPKGE